MTKIPERYDADLITDPDELENLCDRLADEGLAVGYDVETSYEGEPRADAAKHPEENFICGFSLTNSLSWARAVPVAFESGPNTDSGRAAKCVRHLAQARDSQGRPLLVPHNGVFELRCTARWFARELGMTLEEAYWPLRSDTMVEAYIEAEHESYALKTLTLETFGIEQPSIMTLFETPGSKKLTKFQEDSIQFHLLDPLDPKVITYMCDDAHRTLGHHLLRYPKVTDPSFRGSFLYKVDMGQLPIICAMSDVGIAYDWTMMAEAAQRGQAFLARLGAEINGMLSADLGRPVALNLASPLQIQKILYDKAEGLGLPVKRRSKKTNNPSTDKNAMKALADVHPVIRKIQSYRGIKRRVIDNYAGKYEQDYNYAADGRAHPNVLYTAVTTGRFAFSRPAAQQPPKTKTWQLDSGETFTFPWRDFITVPPPGALGDTEHKGWYILGYDYSQQELRVMAGEAQEPALLEAYARGDDVHRVTAAKMLGVPFDQVDEDQRAVGKVCNFALGYQLSPPSLAESLGVPKEEGQRLYDAWFATYPRIKVWTEVTVAEAVKRGYTMSRYGRKHPIWEFAKTCPACAKRGITSKWTDCRTRCPRCNFLGIPKSEAVVAKGMRLAGNAPVQGAGTGDYVRIAQIRADRALRQAGIRDKVHLFLNVHDSLDFYVRRDLDPGEVIRVLQPAVVFPVEGWPQIVADWHMGLRMGSLKELEIGLDFAWTVKRTKAEAAVPSEDDEDDESPEPVAVDLSALKALALVPPSSDGSDDGGSEPEVRSSGADPRQHASAGQGAFAGSNPASPRPGFVSPADPDGKPRTVIVTLPDMPAAENARRLRAALGNLSGPNTVILRTPAGDVRVPGTSGLAPAHAADVAFILPGATVAYDAASVDYAAIAAGISVLQACSSRLGSLLITARSSSTWGWMR